MPGLFDVAHCDPCGVCEIACAIASLADVTEECEAGWTWATSPNRWVATSSGAFNFTALAMPSSSSPFNVAIGFKVNWSGSGTSARVRLYGGMLDCDDYWFVELSLFKVGSAPLATYSLGTTSAGTDTVEAINPHSGNISRVATSFSGTTTYTMTLCWNGESLSSVSSQIHGTAESVLYAECLTDMALLFEILQANGITGPAPGTLAGFEVLDLSNVTSVEVTSFTFERSTDEEAECTECLKSCCTGVAPDEMTVEISDPSPYALTDVLLFGCTFNCSNILGTFTVPNHAGDGVCRYIYRSPTASFQFSCGDPPTPFGSYYLEIRVSIWNTTSAASANAKSASKNITVTVLAIRSDFDLSHFFRIACFKTTGITAPCEDWDDWIDLTTEDTDACNESGTLTCRIKRV